MIHTLCVVIQCWPQKDLLFHGINVVVLELIYLN